MLGAVWKHCLHSCWSRTKTTIWKRAKRSAVSTLWPDKGLGKWIAILWCPLHKASMHGSLTCNKHTQFQKDWQRSSKCSARRAGSLGVCISTIEYWNVALSRHLSQFQTLRRGGSNGNHSFHLCQESAIRLCRVQLPWHRYYQKSVWLTGLDGDNT